MPDPEVDGVLFVQLDGVPFPVLQWAVQSGAVPHIRRWLASGDYAFREWTPQLPCTTPASQLGILHGTVDGIPAFRWYDRELGRVLVANRPADARVIEERAQRPAPGCSRDDGVSISNLFTGDAPAVADDDEPGRGPARLRPDPAGVRLVPRHPERLHAQPHADRRRDPQGALAGPAAGQARPRPAGAPRTGRSPLLRAVTNGLLRDLNTALVAEEMRRGTKSIYVDYVDYDEIAHHAGMFRPESLAALDGLDRTLGSLAGSPGPLPAATGWWCCPTTASPRAPPSRTGTARRSATCART